jgi:hypothetical protein
VAANKDTVFRAVMQQQQRPAFATMPQNVAGNPKFGTSMFRPSAARTFHICECRCGDKIWTSERA